MLVHYSFGITEIHTVGSPQTRNDVFYRLIELWASNDAVRQGILERETFTDRLYSVPALLNSVSYQLEQSDLSELRAFMKKSGMPPCACPNEMNQLFKLLRKLK